MEDGYAEAEAAATDRIMADIEGESPDVSQATPDAPATPDATPDQPVEESFSDSINPADLKGENLELYKQMQADYTKKTQEIAAYRELGYDAETLQQSVDFTTRLTSDPQYASEVVQELYDLVKEQGLDPLAEYINTPEAPEEPDPEGVPALEDPYTDSEVPAALQQTLNKLTNDLAQMKQADDNRTEQAEIETLQLQIDKQEAYIVKEHPSYDDNDIAMVHRLAWSTDGDLLEANDIYQQQIHSQAEKYLDQKKRVGGSQPDDPSAGGHSETPQTFERLDDPALEELALLRLTQAMEDN